MDIKQEMAMNSTPNEIKETLTIDGLSLTPSSVEIRNNGHSATLRFKFPNRENIQLRGGPLKVSYNLDSIHWHWGESDSAGSEHTLNGKRFSAEVHLVTCNSKFSGFKD